MDEERARALIDAERARAEGLLAATLAAGKEERASDRDTIAESDGAQPLAEEWVDDAVAGQVRERLEALDRASRRLANGTYGLSVLSGAPIPDARLEADPAAELTVEEARSSEH